MNIKTILPLIIFFVRPTFAQTFEQDWQHFKNKEWLLNISKDGNTTYNKKVRMGQLTFTQIKNKQLKFKYDIYYCADIDSVFKIKSIQCNNSCKFNFKNFESLISFKFNNYCYLIKSCPNCDTIRNGVKLFDSLQKYIDQNK